MGLVNNYLSKLREERRHRNDPDVRLARIRELEAKKAVLKKENADRAYEQKLKEDISNEKKTAFKQKLAPLSKIAAGVKNLGKGKKKSSFGLANKKLADLGPKSGGVFSSDYEKPKWL